MSDGAWQKVRNYAWPGNIRELENAIHHALLVCRNGTILPEDVRLMNNSAPRTRPELTTPKHSGLGLRRARVGVPSLW